MVETNGDLAREVIKMQREIAEKDKKVLKAYERLFIQSITNEKLRSIIEQQKKEIIDLKNTAPPEPEMCADLINLN